MLAKQAGLDQLPEAYRAELLAAWRQVARMAARIPQGWPYAAEPAHVFDPARFTNGYAEIYERLIGRPLVAPKLDDILSEPEPRPATKPVLPKTMASRSRPAA